VIIGATILRRIIHRFLKQLLSQAKIKVDGQKITWLRLLSQSVYFLAFYIAISSLRINNPNVTFDDFLNHDFIGSKHFSLRFYSLLVIVAIYFGARMLINLSKLYISKKIKEKNDADQGSEYVYTQLAKYVISLLAFFTCLKALNIEIAILLTGSAALLVGLGLGLQDVLKICFQE
jgi:small-conductance mechanosensitive channel